MTSLIQSLQGRDIGHLHIIAQFWGIELPAADKKSVLKELIANLLMPDHIKGTLESLTTDARSALETLLNSDGRHPWAAFIRRYGGIRDVGRGPRDREKIFLHPISPTEELLFRGLMAKSFFDLPRGPQEFAYIPDDLLLLIKNWAVSRNRNKGPDPSKITDPLGHPASQKDHQQTIEASDRLLDDATTLLAATRMGLPPPVTFIPVNVVKDFLSAAKIVLPASQGTGREDSKIQSVRIFLKATRKEALEGLQRIWLDSDTFNELIQVPGIIFEGVLTYQPQLTRQFLLGLLKTIPKNTWWSLSSFILAIKKTYPDFMRPNGDYDSWFIKRESDGTYLRGFDHWEDVEGALIRYFITGPMFWLGQVELGNLITQGIVNAFRLITKDYIFKNAEIPKLNVTAQSKITIPRLFPRASRYQISRFCEWNDEINDDYHYRVTTDSLSQAMEQGLKISQLLSLLVENSTTGLPPAFNKALKRWEIHGTEARIETQAVLRVSSPDVLEELRKSRAGRFLGESLGPVTTVVKPGAQIKVLNALAEMGLLAKLTPQTSESLGKPSTKHIARD
jgi:hypothetical protein